MTGFFIGLTMGLAVGYAIPFIQAWRYYLKHGAGG